MRIAMEGVYGSKRVSLGDSKYLRIWAQTKGKDKQYSFPSMKEHMVPRKPEIGLGYSSYRWSRIRKNGDKFYFGEARIPPEEANQEIDKINNEIRVLEAKRQQYLEDNYWDWPFLDLETAISLVKANKEHADDKSYTESEQKFIDYLDKTIPEVLKQKGWIKDAD
jgi:hypothetical protein